MLDTSVLPSELHRWLEEEPPLVLTPRTPRQTSLRTLHAAACVALHQRAPSEPEHEHEHERGRATQTRHELLLEGAARLEPCCDSVVAPQLRIPGADYSQTSQLTALLRAAHELTTNALSAAFDSFALLTEELASARRTSSLAALAALVPQLEAVRDAARLERERWALGDAGLTALLEAAARASRPDALRWLYANVSHEDAPTSLEVLRAEVPMPLWGSLTAEQLTALKAERVAELDDLLAERERLRALLREPDHLLVKAPPHDLVDHRLLIAALARFGVPGHPDVLVLPRALAPLLHRRASAGRPVQSAALRRLDPRVLETAAVLLADGAVTPVQALRAATALERR